MLGVVAQNVAFVFRECPTDGKSSGTPVQDILYVAEHQNKFPRLRQACWAERVFVVFLAVCSPSTRRRLQLAVLCCLVEAALLPFTKWCFFTPEHVRRWFSPLHMLASVVETTNTVCTFLIKKKKWTWRRTVLVKCKSHVYGGRFRLVSSSFGDRQSETSPACGHTSPSSANPRSQRESHRASWFVLGAPITRALSNANQWGINAMPPFSSSRGVLRKMRAEIHEG